MCPRTIADNNLCGCKHPTVTHQKLSPGMGQNRKNVLHLSTALQDVASCSSLLKSPGVPFLFPPVNLWKVASRGLGRRYSKTNGNKWLRPLSEGNGSACMFYDKRLCSNSASDTKLHLPHFCHFIYELSAPTLGKHCRISNP